MPRRSQRVNGNGIGCRGIGSSLGESCVNMVERTATICNRDGIHCRPATLLVKFAEDYEGKVEVANKRGQTDLTSIFEILGLALLHGDSVTIRVTGPDEEQRCAQLAELFETHFDFPPRP